MDHPIKNVSIIGLGSLGTLYASHLSQKIEFKNLRIIADQSRIDRYQKREDYYNGKKIHFNYVTPDSLVAPADLLIVAVKYPQLDEAIEAIKNHIGENTIILSVLNGIESEKDIAKVYGEEHLLYCVAQGMKVSKAEDQIDCILFFGELNKTFITEKVVRLKRFFEKTKIPFEIDNQMETKLWNKLMINVGINQTVSYFNSTIEIVQNEGAPRSMMKAAMKEVVCIAQKEGIPLTQSDLSYGLNFIDGLTPGGMPSMAQDVKAKRYSEIEMFAGTIVKLGKKHNISVPINSEFYRYFIELEKGY